MTPKLSYYTIFSDQVNDKGDLIVFSTRTAQATLVAKNVHDKLLNGQFETLAPVVFDKLVADKCIVDAEEDELATIITENRDYIDSSTSLYEVIQPSAMCQLGCDYCGQQHRKDYLGKDLFDKLLDRIRIKVKRNGGFTNLFIGWFGGEPLMALSQIRELTPALKALAAELGMTYGSKIVTNGMILKKNIYKELVNELSVRQIEVTLDGTAEFHDKRRHTKEGFASFDIIFRNLLDIFSMEDYKDYKCFISIRCNVDGRNFEGVSPLIKLLAANNLQDKIAYFYTVGVYSWGGNAAHTKSLTKEEYAAKEIEWMMELLEYGFKPSLLPQRQKQVCMAVSRDTEMYDAYGNIFNCTEVSLTSVYEGTPYILGNLKDGSTSFSANKPLNDWNEKLTENRFPCHSCRMLPVCGGGCPKSWHEDMRACPSAKFNIRERLLVSHLVSKGTFINDLNKATDVEVYSGS